MKQIPTRIQRTRQNRQQSPNNLPIIYVGRPTKWGNPFKLVKGKIYVQKLLKSNSKSLKPTYLYVCDGDLDMLLRLYKSVLTGFMQPGKYNLPVDNLKLLQPWVNYYTKLKVTELSNKNLSCWCKLGAPCHADILIDLANQ